VVFLIKNRVKRSQGLAKEKICPTNWELPTDSKKYYKKTRRKILRVFFCASLPAANSANGGLPTIYSLNFANWNFPPARRNAQKINFHRRKPRANMFQSAPLEKTMKAMLSSGRIE
jgi:hypothetical protein